MNKINKVAKEIYLDASATTPPLENVIEVVSSVQKNCWGNPSSLHYGGIRSAEVLERSRKLIARKLSIDPKEIIFTSGATESVNLGIQGICNDLPPGRIIISKVEHPAVIYAANKLKSKGWIVEYCPVDNRGLICLDQLGKLLEEPTKFVSIIWGQSEIGTIQPILQVGKECQKRNIIFHTDATQILPHGIFNWNNLPVNLLSLSAHKFRGPKGIGMLLVKNNTLDLLSSIQGGGSQENKKRSGTEAVPLIAGMAEAVLSLDNKLIPNDFENIFKEDYVSKLTHYLREELSQFSNISFTGDEHIRLPNHISFVVSDFHNNPISGRLLVREFSKHKIALSSGTACSMGSSKDSEVLASIGIPISHRQSGLRMSLGNWLTDKDIEIIPKIFSDIIKGI